MNRPEPRFVAVVAEEIAASADKRIWISETSPSVKAGEKVQVVFPDNQVRIYRLEAAGREHAEARHKHHRMPPRFRVGRALTHTDHVIHSGCGLSIYVPLASRKERVRWMLSRMRDDNLLDHIEAATELQHLVAHTMLMTSIGRRERDDMGGFFASMQGKIFRAIWADDPEMQLIHARDAVALGKRMVFDESEEEMTDGSTVQGNH